MLKKLSYFQKKFKMSLFPKSLQIVKMGNPILRQIAVPWTKEEIVQTETINFVKKLRKIMKKNNGGGIAAPQVSISKQLFIIDQTGDLPDTIKSIPDLAIFNPVLQLHKTKETFPMWESCLSVPSFWGRVHRCNSVTMTFLDENAKERKMKASGFIAAILQHEYDHLIGKVYLDRMSKEQIETVLCDEEHIESMIDKFPQDMEGSWEWID